MCLLTEQGPPHNLAWCVLHRRAKTIFRRTSRSVGRPFAALGVAALAVLLLGAGCIPGQEWSASRPAFLAGLDRLAVMRESRPMRGDLDFQPGDLPDSAGRLYEELRISIDSPEQREYIDRLAASDNLYEYGRLVQTYISALLTALRLTGDLALLDRVDELSQSMRAQLDDSWRGVREGNRRDGKDGYLNWVWGSGNSDYHQGKDVHETDEIRTHALVAEIAWAFRLNSDLPSPAGVDYGERSDFWLGYLENHFEAKWRERNDVAWPRFPFLQRPYVHPTLALTKYHYYMYRLTDRREYLREAMRLSDVLFAEIREIETDAGAAFVWRRSIISHGGNENYLMPTAYSSLVIVDALSLHFEGFYGWADRHMPSGLATMVAEFLIDNGTTDFARDIGGGQARAGIRASSVRDWKRQTATEYSINSFGLLAAWDESGKIAEVSREIYRDLPSRHRYPYIPAGLLVAEVLKDP